MGPSFGTILSIVKKNHTTKIVCIADNVIPHEKRIGDHWFTSYFISKPDAFIVMSEKVRQDLLVYRPDASCELIDHPLYDNFGEKVDKLLARNILHINSQEKIVLFFGFIRKYKGLDLLLEAMAKVKSSSPNIKLLVAGEFYEDSTLYEELLDQQGIRNDVYWHTHFITDSDVKNYLSAADVVVQPYRNATQSGVTPLAYHFEIPMIVTNVGSLARLVPHGKVGLVCEPNAESISKAILQFFEMEPQMLSENIKREKQKLSWAQLFEKITALVFTK
jgi:glycosyltransferase involved in cell wall biosynthesis